MKRTLLLAILFFLPVTLTFAQSAWINELHYDNTGGDTGEFVEVTIDGVNCTDDVSAYAVVLYNGNGGAEYDSFSLDQNSSCSVNNGFAFFWVETDPLQNGSPDGVALVKDGTLLQFLSYEGSFMAVGGSADGLTSTDIGVSETGSTPIGESLQLTGNGTTYGDFTWMGPASESPGAVNAGQMMGSRGGNASCPAGTELLAKFENDNEGDLAFEKPVGNENEVSIESINTDSEDEIVSGSWTSATGVEAIVVKGGPVPADYILFNSPATSGTFDNSVIGGFEISNLQFCASTSNNCIDNLPRLKYASDIKDEDARTISNTVRDGDGLTELEFTKLDGIGSVSITSPGGVTWTTTDGGVTWVPPAGATPTEATYVLKASADNGAYFLVATSDCGEVMNFDPPFAVTSTLGNEFALDGSYPNPTRSASTVSFALDEATPVTLAVYDVMGRKVATLVDAPMDAGQHEVRWDGRSTSGAAVASGVYLLRLQAGEKIATRRLTVVK